MSEYIEIDGQIFTFSEGILTKKKLVPMQLINDEIINLEEVLSLYAYDFNKIAISEFKYAKDTFWDVPQKPKYNFWPKKKTGDENFFFYPDWFSQRPFWPKGQKGPILNDLMLFRYFKSVGDRLYKRNSLALLLTLCKLAQMKMNRKSLFIKLCFLVILSHQSEIALLQSVKKYINCIPLQVDRNPSVFLKLIEHFLSVGTNRFDYMTFVPKKKFSSTEILPYKNVVLNLDIVIFLLQWYHVEAFKRVIYNEYIETNSYLSHNKAWEFGRAALFKRLRNTVKVSAHFRFIGKKRSFLLFLFNLLNRKYNVILTNNAIKSLQVISQPARQLNVQYKLISNSYLLRYFAVLGKIPKIYFYKNNYIRLAFLLNIYLLTHRIWHDFFTSYSKKARRTDFTNYRVIFFRITYVSSENRQRKWIRFANNIIFKKIFNMFKSEQTLTSLDLLTEFNVYYKYRVVSSSLCKTTFFKNNWYISNYMYIIILDFFDHWRGILLKTNLSLFMGGSGNSLAIQLRKMFWHIFGGWLEHFLLGYINNISISTTFYKFFLTSNYIFWKFIDIQNYTSWYDNRLQASSYLKKIEIESALGTRGLGLWQSLFAFFKHTFLVDNTQIVNNWAGLSPNLELFNQQPYLKLSSAVLFDVLYKMYLPFFQKKMAFLYYYVDMFNYTLKIESIFSKIHQSQWINCAKNIMGRNAFVNLYRKHYKMYSNISCKNRMFSNFSDTSRKRWAWISHRLYRCGMPQKKLPMFPEKGVNYIAVLSKINKAQYMDFIALYKIYNDEK